MELSEKLKRYGQEHLLRFDGLNDEERRAYLAELESLDLDFLANRAEAPARGNIAPIEGLSCEEIEARREEFEKVGLRALKEGKVAAILLAGGQGTRLGSAAPKGAFDIGVTRPLYIFELHLRHLLSVSRLCGAFVPLFIMTNAQNDRATREFLKEHGYFGYPADHIRFFVQEMLPSTDLNGKILLEDRGKLALSPNGNGGFYISLKKSGIEREFPSVEWYNVFAVDNVLQRSADPAFIGATLLSGAACGAKVVAKRSPEERVGVLCLEDGKPSVIEYFELPEAIARARDGAGRLLYRWGVTLNYLFSRRMLEDPSSKGIGVHVVKKKIPYYENGNYVLPETENGYKFETLILDMVRLAGTCLPFEVVREREFAPVKNKSGEDSVETARRLLSACGVEL